MQENTEKISIAPILKELAIGDTAEFSLQRLSVVRSTVTSRSLDWDKKFTTQVDRENGVIKVRREK